jgi:hypothetical protein
MNERVNYRINGDVKNEYNEFITEKYGSKLGTLGTKVEKAMKFQMMLEGNEKYRDDPDVIAMLGKVRELDNTHTHKTSLKKDSNEIDEKIDKAIEDKLDIFTEKIISKVDKKIKGDSPQNKKIGSMSVFKKNFQMKYEGYSQVSRRDIARFVMNTDGVHDSRSIQNRIEYLVANDVIEPFAQNVYNVLF